MFESYFLLTTRGAVRSPMLSMMSSHPCSAVFIEVVWMAVLSVGTYLLALRDAIAPVGHG